MIEDSADAARRWLNELRSSKREDERWTKRGKKIVKRYRDERGEYSKGNDKRYNILWSNIQTMLPALYGKTPRAQVERRWKDQDPVGRTASIILERVLQYEIDHHGDFDEAARAAVQDRLLPGRGVTWIRLETEDVQDAQGQATTQTRTPVDYVYWEDFRVSPARCWAEVTWVARRVYMTRKAGIARFGEDFKDVPLTSEPIGLDEFKKQGAVESDLDELKKAQVWEIWDKTTKSVIWVAEGCQYLLDQKPDPYGLDEFWPCPKPLYATQTSDTLVPVPDFALYQDQAEEIDMLTNRIALLAKAVKVVGVYDASQPSIQRMLNEGVDNTLIPVDQWAGFAEKGGLKGTIDFMPLDSVIGALQACYEAREQAKQVIYEVTGLSDIIRGASVASETATAQEIKSQYASLRLKRLQTDVAEFTSDMLRIKGQLVADMYSPQALVEMSGIMGTMDAQYAEQAVMLLKTEPARSFRIEVASDSLVEMDEMGEKQSRIEFLTATGQFMERSLPVAQQVPEMAPLIGEMLLFGVRAFKGGRPMEAAFDEAIAKLKAPQEPKPQPPSPEEVKAQADMQLEQMRQQAKQGELQVSAQMEQFKAQNMQAVEAAKLQAQQQAEAEKAQLARELEMMRIQSEQQIEAARLENAREIERIKQEAETAREMQRLELEAVGKLIDGQKAEERAEGAEEEKSAIEEKHAEVLEGIRDMVKAMREPKVRKLVRGPDGRAAGIVETTE